MARAVYKTRVSNRSTANVTYPRIGIRAHAVAIAPTTTVARKHWPTTRRICRGLRSARNPASGPTRRSGNDATMRPRRNACSVSPGFRSNRSTCARPSDVIASATCEEVCAPIAIRNSRIRSTSRRRTGSFTSSRSRGKFVASVCTFTA